MAEARYHRFVALATEIVPTIIHPKTIKDSVRYRNGTVATTLGQGRNREPWRAPGSHRTVCTSVVLFSLVDPPCHQRLSGGLGHPLQLSEYFHSDQDVRMNVYGHPPLDDGPFALSLSFRYSPAGSSPKTLYSSPSVAVGSEALGDDLAADDDELD